MMYARQQVRLVAHSHIVATRSGDELRQERRSAAVTFPAIQHGERDMCVSGLPRGWSYSTAHWARFEPGTSGWRGPKASEVWPTLCVR